MDQLFSDALCRRFDPRQEGRPYPSDEACIQDYLSLVSLALTVAATYKSAQLDAREVKGENFPGTVHTEMEATAHVGDFPNGLPPLEPDMAEMLRRAREHLESRLEAGDAPCELRMERLRQVCGGDGFAFFCAVCALCSSLDRGFERMFSLLHGQEALAHPTLGTAQSLYQLAYCVEGRQAPFLQPQLDWLLFVPAKDCGPPLLRPLVLRPALLAYLMRQDAPSGMLFRAARLDREAPEAFVGDLGPQLSVCRALLEDGGAPEKPRLVVLNGEPGAGKKRTLGALAREGLGRFLLLPMDTYQLKDDLEGLAAQLALRSTLNGEAICLETASLEEDRPFYRLLGLLAGYRPTVFLLAESLRRNVVPEGYLTYRLEYGLPDLEHSIQLWREYAAGLDTQAQVRWEEVAAKYLLTPGRIRGALDNAAALSRATGQKVDSALIDQAVLLGNSGRLSEIADPIPTFYRWEDLVLGDAAREMLRTVCDRIRHRHVVESQWGFRRRSAYGNGISILLYGPPGTGKTMSAQVLAGELGLPLYRINLAQMISKYIGETAKNLDTVFREARSSNVILFFDEADSLFAKRTDVKNSNDRHANSESAYLLQKIEEYSGISILATNLAHNFDEAFRRRIQYMINIPMPSPEERLLLWQGYVGSGAPLGEDVDFSLLARELELSGSVIKSAVLQAAYFAAAEGCAISMRHLVRGVELELQKLGKGTPHFMGQFK